MKKKKEPASKFPSNPRETQEHNSKFQENPEEPEEEMMTVELNLDSGTVNCAVITILTVEGKDYIVLLPLDENGENDEGDVWFYRYFEDPEDPEQEPRLEYIDDDGEYEKVDEAFDEYLDTCEYDELIDEGEDGEDF